MRGKDLSNIIDVGKSGITPAHAGKSYMSAQFLHTIGDHPRTCGEKRYIYLLTQFQHGSPPHMRGKDLRFL